MPRQPSFRQRLWERTQNRVLHIADMLVIICGLHLVDFIAGPSLIFGVLPLAWIVQAVDVAVLLKFGWKAVVSGNQDG